MKSDALKKGHRRTGRLSLLRCLGLDEKDMAKPFTGMINCHDAIAQGDTSPRKLARAVKAEVLQSWGTRIKFLLIRVCGGPISIIVRGGDMVKLDLASRRLDVDLSADSIEDAVRMLHSGGEGFTWRIPTALRPSSRRGGHRGGFISSKP